MVIHTKEKAELHIKQEPEAKIKGRNVLVVDKSPQIAVMDKEDKTVIKKSSEKEAVKNSMQKEKGVYAQVQRAKQDREKAIGKKNSTAISPRVGTAIGLAAGSVVGYTAGVEMDYKDMKATSRARKLKFFLDKMNAEEQQKDSFAKLVKDLVVCKVFMMLKAAAPIIGLVLLLLVDQIINNWLHFTKRLLMKFHQAYMSNDRLPDQHLLHQNIYKFCPQVPALC